MGDFTTFQWLVMFGIGVVITQLHFIYRATQRNADTTYKVLEYLCRREMH